MDKRTQKRKIGDIGESIATKFLVKRGFEILERNYWKKVGEIDVVCKKDGKFYFVEVKTVSSVVVSRETGDNFRPEDNIHSAKIARMDRAIQIYLEEAKYDGDWEVIGVMIEINELSKEARVRLLDNFAW